MGSRSNLTDVQTSPGIRPNTTMQYTTTWVTDNGAVATRTRSGCNAAAPQLVCTMSIFSADTNTLLSGPMPMPSIREIKAAIPEQGIDFHEFYRLFSHYKTGEAERDGFFMLAYEVAEYDQATNMIRRGIRW